MDDKMAIAQETLFVFEGRGIQPGSFTYSLIKTMALADSENLQRLSFGFQQQILRPWYPMTRDLI